MAGEGVAGIGGWEMLKSVGAAASTLEEACFADDAGGSGSGGGTGAATELAASSTGFVWFCEIGVP